MTKQERVLPKACLICGSEIPRRNTYCRACAHKLQIERVRMNYNAMYAARKKRQAAAKATVAKIDTLDSVLRELATENERRHALGLDSLSYGKYTQIKEKEQSDT